jgi:hypothetical protein
VKAFLIENALRDMILKYRRKATKIYALSPLERKIRWEDLLEIYMLSSSDSGSCEYRFRGVPVRVAE